MSNETFVHEYRTVGTCSRLITVEIDPKEDTIKSIQFLGGCPGNTLGISELVKGMKIDDVIKKFSGLRCGMRPTSCPDQLSIALKQAKQLAQEA